MPATFNMKGNAWRALREFIEQVVPGGGAAVSAELNATDRICFAQDFIPSGWYDALPAEAATRIAGRLAGLQHEDFCTRFGESVLKRDMNGIYRAILRFATPDMMAKSLPLASKRYFDFVSMRIEPSGPRNYVMHLSGIPRAVVATYSAVTEVFSRNAIAGSGGKNVRVVTAKPLAGPAVNGMPTVRLERTLTWD